MEPKKGTPKMAYVATVQLFIDAPDSESATDVIASLLDGQPGVIDWSFLRIGGQYLYPTERYYTPENYEEGGFTGCDDSMEADAVNLMLAEPDVLKGLDAEQEAAQNRSNGK